MKKFPIAKDEGSPKFLLTKKRHKYNQTVTPGLSSRIDSHPFARGSVIEIYHSEVDYKDLDDDYNGDEKGTKDENSENSDAMIGNRYTHSSTLLADIIDRMPSVTPQHRDPSRRWKYYVHYRNYNRRMDEWIDDPSRIASPPSIGNSKIRAMRKKEIEERRFLRLGECNDSLLSKNGINSVTNTLSAPHSFLKVTSKRASINSDILLSSDEKVNNRNSIKLSSIMKNSSITSSGRVSRRRSSRASTSSTIETEKQSTLSMERNSTNTSYISNVLLPVNHYTSIKDQVVTVTAKEMDEHEGLDKASLKEHEEVTKVKNVSQVQIGKYCMEAWYFSPIPKEILSQGCTNRAKVINTLYVCEFTFNFFLRKIELLRFQAKIFSRKKRHPPGNEIYRNGNLSVFEVDGYEERIYCQNLCYIAKLFLDHKTLYYDVDPFLFFILCEVDNRGYHPVGYYSKEKYSDVGYNLACILTFPSYQRKGYGRFLISFSYEITKMEEKVGSPEKPLSDLGQQAYKPYWTTTILEFLINNTKESSFSIMDISKRTSIMAEDIIFTLNLLGLLKFVNGVYFITAEPNILEELVRKYPVKEPRVDCKKIHWTPYINGIKHDKFSLNSKNESDNIDM